MRLHSGMERRGFTLIELSIVLVIIALIVGGILVGRELIGLASQRATVSQIERYNTAANAFRSKYHCMPGDCATATTYFGAKASCTDNNGVAIVGTETCNGSGDGIVSADGGTESQFFWQQLSAAGLIPEPMRATNYNINGQDVATTLPPSKIGGGNYFGVAYNDGGIDYLTSDIIRQLYLVGNANTAGTYVDESGVQPKDGFALDTKIDDGLPNTGKVMFIRPNGAPCTSTALGYYDLTTAANDCQSIIGAAF